MRLDDRYKSMAPKRQIIRLMEVPIFEADLAAWEAWACKYADSLDPVISGQVLSHMKTVSGTADLYTGTEACDKSLTTHCMTFD